MLLLRYAEAKPNILLIIGDDQKWTDFGFMGHSIVRTPNLDRLSEEGILFTRGYVPVSLCRPSLASIITGLYPHQHGIIGNDPLRTEDDSDADYQARNERIIQHIENVATLPRLLAEVGYLSFQSGKWWEGNYRRGGFTHGMTHGEPNRQGRHGDDGLRIGREGLGPLFEFIEEAGDRPFFIWYAPFLPHTPHNPPEEILARYRESSIPVPLQKYYAMCEWFDRTVGELLDFIDEKRLSENTLVIFVTDNGWIQRTDETMVPTGWNFQFAPQSKRSPNESGIRTPMIVKWPDKVEPSTSAVPVSSIDIAPTLLEAAGLKVPQTMSGLNLLDERTVNGRESIFGSIFTHDILDLEDPIASLKDRWVIQGKWKLIVPHSKNILDAQVQLYDVVSDPDETENLIIEEAVLARKLLQTLDRWW
jgi:uncharacterized sulfatase